MDDAPEPPAPHLRLDQPPAGDGPQRDGATGHGPGAAWAPLPPPPARRRATARVVRRALHSARFGWTVATLLLATVVGLAVALASVTDRSAPSLGAPVASAPGNATVPGGSLPTTMPAPGALPTSPSTAPAGSGSPSPGIDGAAVAAAVDPAVVDIDTTTVQGGGGAGTGMVLSPGGLVLTNNHVIEDAATITIQVDGTGSVYDATVLGYSVTDDVALVQIQGVSGLHSVTTGRSATLTVGQPVVTIGNSLGRGGTPAAMTAAVTALDQTITAGDPGASSETLHGLLEMNAPIQPGDSGGPVVDAAGQVVAMNTAAAGGSGFGVQSRGQAYAVGIDVALAVVRQIEAGQPSATVHVGPRAVLGLEVTDASGGGGLDTGPSTRGAYVDQVEPGSPAATTGITAGDTVVSVDGTAVGSAAALGDALAADSPGDHVVVGWTDAVGASHSATVALVAGPPA